MPTYSHKCPQCKQVKDDVRPVLQAGQDIQCDKCGVPMPRYYGNANVAGSVWDSEKQYEHFDVNPMRFRTKGDMRRFCRQNGLESGAL